MAKQYIVAAFLDGTLNISATGPFRSEAKAEEACDRINQAGDWTSEMADYATIIAQVVPLRSASEIVAEAKPTEQEPGRGQAQAS